MSDAARIRAAVAVLGVAYVALWACAPIASGPPPAPMADGREHELGGTFSFVQTPNDASSYLLGNDCSRGVAVGCSGPSLAAWYRFDRGRWDLTTQVYGGVPTFVGLTGRLAVRAVQTDHVFVAPAVQAGWLTGGLSVPVGLAVSPDTWLVLTPTAQLSAVGLVRGSAGVWHTGPKGAVVGVELGLGTAFGTTPIAGDVSVQLGGQLP
jgi:hypothetical protein